MHTAQPRLNIVKNSLKKINSRNIALAALAVNTQQIITQGISTAQTAIQAVTPITQSLIEAVTKTNLAISEINVPCVSWWRNPLYIPNVEYIIAVYIAAQVLPPICIYLHQEYDTYRWMKNYWKEVERLKNIKYLPVSKNPLQLPPK